MDARETNNLILRLSQLLEVRGSLSTILNGRRSLQERDRIYRILTTEIDNIDRALSGE